MSELPLKSGSTPSLGKNAQLAATPMPNARGDKTPPPASGSAPEFAGPGNMGQEIVITKSPSPEFAAPGGPEAV